MREHHATNIVDGGNELLPDVLARKLFEQQAVGTIAWQDLAPAERAVWLSRAEQSLRALAGLGYRPELLGDAAVVDLDASVTSSAAREAESFLSLGEPLLAYNIVQNALVDHSADLRLRQLKGLALARSGALQRAHDILSGLCREGHSDAETLGILARTHKDLALAGQDSSVCNEHLSAAFEIYASAYRESRRQGRVADAYYTGINAATMAYLCGDIDTARGIAVEVESICTTALEDGRADDSDYWMRATLAEAALILGKDALARQRYADASRLAGTRFGNLSSTRHQARLLLEYAGKGSEWLDDVLSVPPVLVYTGHMIDAPGRAHHRFGPDMEDDVRAEIRRRLEQVGPAAAYGSAACGADILCLECVQELGGELHIVLPFPVEAFLETSVEFRDEGRWGDRFRQLLDAANEVLVISEHPPAGDASAYEYANLIITGLAQLRARVMDTHLQGLAVWDGSDTGDPGGTASVVGLWRSANVPIEHVKLTSPLQPAAAPTARGPGWSATETPGWAYQYSIEAMLFADATGYSRLTEKQIPLFFEHYMGMIAELNRTTKHRALHVETAGDGLYMVFDDTGTAAHYALELSELIAAQDWLSCGLPEDLGVRVGLHCGPVFVGRDPITGLPLYSGTHTSRTARIEPITPPGQVYASSAFAAVSAARKVGGLRFSYIGRTRLAKHYGVLPLYHVKRAARHRPAADRPFGGR
jgi:class 3 adenylate cyclase